MLSKYIKVCVFVCRGESQLEEGEDPVPVVLAVRPHMGPVSYPGLGAVRPGALRAVLLSGLGGDETRRPLFRHFPLFLQPGPAQRGHHLLLLWHRHEALLHLQKVGEQQPRPQYHQTPPAAVDRK